MEPDREQRLGQRGEDKHLKPQRALSEREGRKENPKDAREGEAKKSGLAHAFPSAYSALRDSSRTRYLARAIYRTCGLAEFLRDGLRASGNSRVVPAIAASGIQEP